MYLCLVLLCDQNSFGRSKMVLVWPNWFRLDRNDLVTTKMKWSRPKWIGQVQIVIFKGRNSQFGPDQFILVMTISFWSWPNHYGQVQINLVRPKPFWTDQNCFGHIEGQGIRYWRVGKIRKSGIVQWPEQMPSAVWPSSNEEIGENKPEVIFLTRHEPHMNPNS